MIWKSQAQLCHLKLYITGTISMIARTCDKTLISQNLIQCCTLVTKSNPSNNGDSVPHEWVLALHHIYPSTSEAVASEQGGRRCQGIFYQKWHAWYEIIKPTLTYCIERYLVAIYVGKASLEPANLHILQDPSAVSHRTIPARNTTRVPVYSRYQDEKRQLKCNCPLQRMH